MAVQEGAMLCVFERNCRHLESVPTSHFFYVPVHFNWRVASLPLYLLIVFFFLVHSAIPHPARVNNAIARIFQS